MFSFSGGLLAGQHDCRKERPPPSRPVPVTFPSLTPPAPSLPNPPPAWSEGPLPGIPAHFIGLKKPSDVSVDTLALLNITFEPQCDFETLLSSLSNDAQSHLPPKSWLETPDQRGPETSSTSEPSVSLLSNGKRVPDRNEFHVRAKELYFKNEAAFSTLTRKADAGQAPLRLAHFRKFWEGLDNMAYYWDTSLDEYIPPKPEHVDGSDDKTPSPLSAIANAKSQENDAEAEIVSKLEATSGFTSPNVEEPRKKAKTEAVSNDTIALPMNSLGFGGSGSVPTRPAFISSSTDLPARTAPPKVPWAMNMEHRSQKPVDLSKGSYRGYRIGNGAEMPDQYRLECVRGFLEPIAWAFGVTFVPHRRPPVLLLEHMRFPVRMNSVAWRGPADRMRARQGWMEGPVLGIQCRADTNFGSTGNLEAESILDAVRELGGMLLLAQERAREGKTERRSGEGKWWTTQHRWGGGPGGEVGEATGASDAPSQDAMVKAEEKPGRPRLGSNLKDRRRATPAEIWNVLRPGNPLWDPKIVYEAIGKDRSVEWDEVFMVSSLNHHISILKLRVHPLYVRYLTEGILPEGTPSDPDWCSPKLQRTRWFDLFNIEDRTESMRGIWGIMSYLMRSQERVKGDVAMSSA
ncbi:hypothetical protein K505DRAFT_404623 [Melanomma pulvis-pyrius CBS 109.77]|uniref:Uncharacterized protein n=1 Tax=Melanomma pulvis-pyrius CBS 109.77 TaxID=1314802 RepID=A0A6A6XSN5_9PLEO|nr:hypothetical protein K505DRAFT_404623 [Melanomma pulvis-pyrius CBS 109.77]